ITLTLHPHTRLALVGPNGSGKSTLLSILANLLPPDTGTRTTRRDLRLAHLPQSPTLPAAPTLRASLHASLTERAATLAALDALRHSLTTADPTRTTQLLARQSHLETQLATLGGHDIDPTLDAELAHFGLHDADRPFDSFSEGELRRAALAGLFLAGPELLLLDEPTNQLDVFTIDALEDRLLAERRPFVLVTHDRYFLDRVVTEIAELDRGALHVYPGSYADYLAARADRLSTEDRQNSARNAVILRETAWMRRGAPARTTKQKARITRFEELTADGLQSRSRELELELLPGPRLGSRVVTLRAITKVAGGRPVFSKLDFELLPGERVGIVGANGAGKSLFLALCSGTVAPDAGSRELGETVRFAALDAQRQPLDPEKTVIEELAGRSDQIQVGDRVLRAESFLERFLFPGTMKHAPIRQLSGGERMRVLLAKLLIAGGNVLLLDEPTNDLDLATLRAFEEALGEFPGSALIVSHDRWFLDRIATRILYLDGKGAIRHHIGDLSSLLEKLANERAEREKPKTAPAPRASTNEDTKKRAKGLAPWEQREYDALLATIAASEAELATLDAALADPALYTTRRAELAPLQTQRKELQTTLDASYARWQELEEKLAG
ncbi:MAG: ABC-F family ATP-binding cassette domain-containing protein, partial [Planctomycetes bacterium]|nr:ABC-F family ATP-binding cassette domain-containing protein [Planctomycetota bacterium]